MDKMPVPELIHFILCWCQYNNLDIFCHLPVIHVLHKLHES